jgi:hypothetical protein
MECPFIAFFSAEVMWENLLIVSVQECFPANTGSKNVRNHNYSELTCIVCVNTSTFGFKKPISNLVVLRLPGLSNLEIREELLKAVVGTLPTGTLSESKT